MRILKLQNKETDKHNHKTRQYEESILSNIDENDNCVKHCDVCRTTVVLSFEELIANIESEEEKLLIFLTLGAIDSAFIGSFSK